MLGALNDIDTVQGFSFFSSYPPFIPRFIHLMNFFSRMIGDDEDEGALSDSDGQSGLAADDLASK